jgi:uncharacterized protein
MKLHLSPPSGTPLVTAIGNGFVEVNRVRYLHSILVTTEAVQAWAVPDLMALTRDTLQHLVAARPELILLGTGAQHRFPAPAVYQDLINAGIGVEIMQTDAACRTFNYLASEGRRVVAALIIEAVNPA